MTKTLAITITGRPVPKKNNPVMVKGRNLILSSKAFRAYEKDALKQLLSYGNVYFDCPVRIDAYYWLPDKRWWPDLCGLFQSTADILEKSGLLINDKQIVSWGTSRICGLSKENPRAEITISEAERPGRSAISS